MGCLNELLYRNVPDLCPANRFGKVRLAGPNWDIRLAAAKLEVMYMEKSCDKVKSYFLHLVRLHAENIIKLFNYIFLSVEIKYQLKSNIS